MPRKFWDKQKVFEHASKFKRRTDFMTGDVKAYQAAIRLHILAEATQHMPSPIRWTENKIRNLVKGLTYRGEFRILYRSAYQRARELGLLYDLTGELLKTTPKLLNQFKKIYERQQKQKRCRILRRRESSLRCCR